MIEVEHLSKVYRDTPAIADVTFQVEAGEILGFLGPNGAGKTTTMRILTGYLPASSGTARIAGYDVHEDSMAVRQRIGYLPESPPLYGEMTVEGFLDFVARLKGVPAGDRPNRVNSAIARCNLVERRTSLIRKLSKGFKQRVGIAQAIVHDPPAIILDEPTVGLDPRQIIEVRNLIKQLAGQHTIILSTHILPEVSMTCDRVAIINRGRIVATNTPDSLLSQLAAGMGYEYELEIAGELPTILACLDNVPGVESVTPLPSVAHPSSASSSDRQVLKVTCQSGVEAGREIATALVSANLGLYEMRRSRASLEDVFLELTMEEAPPTPMPGDEAIVSESSPEASDNSPPTPEATPADDQNSV